MRVRRVPDGEVIGVIVWANYAQSEYVSGARVDLDAVSRHHKRVDERDVPAETTDTHTRRECRDAAMAGILRRDDASIQSEAAGIGELNEVRRRAFVPDVLRVELPVGRDIVGGIVVG